MTGRSAASSMSTVFFTPSGSAPQRDEMLALHSSGFGVSSAAASMNTSNGTSSTTGPGRPVTMVFQACRTIIGTCSPRVGWYTFLQTLRTVEGKSAWCWRYSSWNAPRPNWLVGTLPVTARNGTESR